MLAAPERFASGAFREALAQRRVSLFVVDEAHCVTEWGHDFRPDYLRLHDAIASLGRPPVMAATATATPRVADEIATRLGLREWTSVRAGFDRPNLAFDVVSLEGAGTVARKRAALLHILSDSGARPAIVYCGTRRDTDDVAELHLCCRHLHRPLPRGHVPGCAARQSGGVHGRCGRGGRGDERIRHGRRQGIRAYRRPLGSAHEPRGLLSGGRSWRARRQAGTSVAAGRAHGPRPAGSLQYSAHEHDRTM